MRTTLTLDDDLVHDLKKLARKLNKPFKILLNETLRSGLKLATKSQRSRKFITKPVSMGLRPGLSLDNIQDVLADIEGDGYK